MIDERKSERQAPRIQFGNKICDDATRHLVQRGRPGKERRRMAIVAEAEKNQIVLINWLTAPRWRWRSVGLRTPALRFADQFRRAYA